MIKHPQWLKAAVRDTDDLKSALQSTLFVALPAGSTRSGCDFSCADIKVAKVKYDRTVVKRM